VKRSSSPIFKSILHSFFSLALVLSLLFFHQVNSVSADEPLSILEQRRAKSTTIKEAHGDTALKASEIQAEHEAAVVKGDVSPNSNYFVSRTITSTILETSIRILGSSTEDGARVYGNGAVPALAGLIDNMYDYQPASTQRYVAYLLESAKIVQPAYAQGIGFSSLDPIMEIWTGFRNVAYFMFVLMFLIIGIMIMFRHKISGQTVVTVQQAIPNIIVALIFVTFSYAIGGLLIDAMYLMMYLVVGLFSNSTSVLNSNIFSIGAEFVGSGFNTTHDVIKSILEQVNAGSIIGGLGGITVGFIIAVAMLYGVLKLFVELLKSYVSIILLITFSPIILMTGAMPGQNSFGSWIKNLIGNLVAFPVVLLVLVVSEAINSYGITTGGFAPPFLLGPTVGGGSALAGLVGIGMLLVTPELVKKAKDAMGAKEGVMGELAGTALKRAQQGEIAIPAAETAIRAPIGAGNAMVRSLIASKRAGTPVHIPSLLKQTWGGYQDPATKKYHGGLKRVAGKAWNSGTQKRVLIDRFFEGRLADPEDATKMVAEMLKRQKQQEETDQQESKKSKKKKGKQSASI